MSYTQLPVWRVWPDGTCQEDTDPAYEHMSDDFVLVRAETEEEAIYYAKSRGLV